eukprot:2131548-Prorocentrum_lima.AAC.1
MTSSLVGSEMCIRDRNVRQETLELLERRCAGCQLFILVPIHMTQLFPVSYTHLTLPTICSV